MAGHILAVGGTSRIPYIALKTHPPFALYWTSNIVSRSLCVHLRLFLEGTDQYRMRHAASSPSFELDCPPFSVASNLPKFHSSPNSRPLAPTHPTVYSPPISRDHLAIPAPSHNHLPPSPPHSPVPRYLPSNSVASISHAPSFSNDLPHPSLRYSWKCLNCTRTNSMDMPGCPYCGELAPWIER